MILIGILLLAGLEPSHILTIISVGVGFGVGLLQLYVTMRLAKIKEEMLEIMRKEINITVEKIEGKMVTHQDLISLKDNLRLMFDNIKLEMENSQFKKQSGNQNKNQ